MLSRSKRKTSFPRVKISVLRVWTAVPISFLGRVVTASTWSLSPTSPLRIRGIRPPLPPPASMQGTGPQALDGTCPDGSRSPSPALRSVRSSSSLTSGPLRPRSRGVLQPLEQSDLGPRSPLPPAAPPRTLGPLPSRPSLPQRCPWGTANGTGIPTAAPTPRTRAGEGARPRMPSLGRRRRRRRQLFGPRAVKAPAGNRCR